YVGDDRVKAHSKKLLSQLGEPSVVETWDSEEPDKDKDDKYTFYAFYYEKSVAYLSVGESVKGADWMRLYLYDREWLLVHLAYHLAEFMADLAFVKSHVIDKYHQ